MVDLLLIECYLNHMARVFFKKGGQRAFFSRVQKKTGYSFKLLAQHCGGHQRSYSDWIREKASLPYHTALKLSQLAKVSLPDDIVVRNDYWYTRKAGRLGGIAHIKKYGNPGTPEGRSLGGTRSIATHNNLQTGFQTRKKVRFPRKNAELAELLGIILGDGSITHYQVTVTLNSITDADYAYWVKGLCEKLFGVKVHAGRRENTINLTISGVGMVEFLLKNGLKIGNKIRNRVDIPTWIGKSRIFSHACVRGLIDTDGCVYLDTHYINRKRYKYICLAFTSYSGSLLKSVYKVLFSGGLNPTLYKNNLKLRKENDVYRYYKLIGSHNTKHLSKLENFFENSGEVA